MGRVTAWWVILSWTWESEVLAAEPSLSLEHGMMTTKKVSWEDCVTAMYCSW